jgi:hypothetical protein
MYSIFAPSEPTSNLTEHQQQQKNEIANTSIGDILSEKPDGITRCYAQNQNGVNLRDNGHQFKEICEDTRLIQADLRGLIEHNLDTTNLEVRQTCYDIAKQTFSHNILQMSSSSIPFRTHFKPGGTMILAQNDISGRVIKQSSDPSVDGHTSN